MPHASTAHRPPSVSSCVVQDACSVTGCSEHQTTTFTLCQLLWMLRPQVQEALATMVHQGVGFVAGLCWVPRSPRTVPCLRSLLLSDLTHPYAHPRGVTGVFFWVDVGPMWQTVICSSGMHEQFTYLSEKWTRNFEDCSPNLLKQQRRPCSILPQRELAIHILTITSTTKRASSLPQVVSNVSVLFVVSCFVVV